jgi:hypothetical protein
VSNTVREIVGAINDLNRRVVSGGGGTGVGSLANVRDFGALGDASTNDTAAIQAALSAATAGQFAGLFFPPGVYIVTPGMLQAFTSRQGCEIAGSGCPTDTNTGISLGTILKSDGTNSGKPLLNINGASGVRVRDISFWGNTSASSVGSSSGVRWQSIASDGVGAGFGYFSRVSFLWCAVGLDIGSIDSPDHDGSHDGLNCDTYLLDHVGFWNCPTGLKTSQSQNVQFVADAPSFIGCAKAIDCPKGGVMTVDGAACYDVGTLLTVDEGGNRNAFHFTNVGLDGGGSVRTKLLSAASVNTCFVVFDSVAVNPNHLGVASGGASVTLKAGYHVLLRGCSNLGSANGAAFLLDGGGTVVLDGCTIPSTTTDVRDAASSGGAYRVVNCIDQSTHAFVDSYGDLDGSYAAGSLTVTDVKTGSYNAAVGELVRCDPTGGAFPVNLPAVAAANKGRSIIVKNQSASANNITVTPAGADTTDGAPTTVIASARTVRTFTSDGTSDWMIT